MPGNDAYQHDVLIIGGGGAGLRAAIAAAEESGRLSIAVLSKVYPMRSHTVSAEGGTAAVMRENDSLDTHAKDTIFGSDFLADQDVVEAFVKEAPGQVIQLEHWGCPWSRDPDGRVSVRPFGGMTVDRTVFAADKTGFHMLHALFQTSLKYDNILRYDEFYATSLLIDNGKVRGVSAINIYNGQVEVLAGKAVILCTCGGGRTFEGPYGHYVHLDLRHLGEEKINKKIPFVRELAHKYVGIDPVYEPIPVRPVVHYMMGGIHTDMNARTPLEGLYAAGETACVSLNGGNRLGSNSLTQLLVFGNRAGRAAANYPTRASAPVAAKIQALAADEQRRLDRQFFKKDGGKERIATIRQEMQKAMEEGAGIYRDEEKMQQACNTLRTLRERFKNILIEDRGTTFNTEVMNALELDYMLDVAEAVANSALKRTESRGSHTRTDFPKRDDANFLKHSLAFRTPDGPRIEYLPVTITRWQPEERKY